MPRQSSTALSTGLEGLRSSVEGYYSRKLAKFGPTPLGVDWSCVPTQELRFVQLLRACDFSAPFSLNDLGCGYGALLAFLGKRHAAARIDYAGFDISAAMIAQARRHWARRDDANFEVGHLPARVADYSVASGIFNVKLGHTTQAWEALVRATLLDLRETSRRAFCVNFLSLGDSAKGQESALYHADAQQWLDYCESALNARTELRTGYGMREFTLLARV